jgi:hypothetical protein
MNFVTSTTPAFESKLKNSVSKLIKIKLPDSKFLPLNLRGIERIVLVLEVGLSHAESTTVNLLLDEEIINIHLYPSEVEFIWMNQHD